MENNKIVKEKLNEIEMSGNYFRYASAISGDSE